MESKKDLNEVTSFIKINVPEIRLEEWDSIYILPNNTCINCVLNESKKIYAPLKSCILTSIKEDIFDRNTKIFFTNPAVDILDLKAIEGSNVCLTVRNNEVVKIRRKVLLKELMK